MEKKIKTCGYCTHGVWFADRSVGIFGGYDCDNPDLPEDYEDEIGNPNKDCPYFNPIIIKTCGHCHKEINTPEIDIEFFASGYDYNIPCCSEKCKIESEEEVQVVGKRNINFSAPKNDFKENKC